MKRLIVLISLCSLWPLASCGGGGGTLESCVSSYTGSFTGMGDVGVSNGSIVAKLGSPYPSSATVQPVLSFVFRFDTQEDRQFPGSASIAEDGTVMPGSGPDIMGTFDFDTCEGSGTWDYSVYGTGTWHIAPPDSAF